MNSLHATSLQFLNHQIGPVAYPWEYPLALTPVLLLKGVHALALKLPGLFFFIGFLICLYLLIETRLTRTERLLFISLFAFNPTLIKYTDQILSDIPFLFIVFLVLYLIAKLKTTDGVWRYVFLGIAIFAAFFIRTTGVILLASFLAYQALFFFQEREQRKAILQNSGIVVAMFILFWLISSLIFPNGQGAYFRQLIGFTLDMFFTRNIPGYFYFGAQFLGIPLGTAWMFVYYILIVFFLIGAWIRWNTNQILIIFFVLFFSAMVIWPEWQGVRFIFPVMPIFIALLFME